MAKLAGDHVQVLVSGYDLTGDHNQITIADARDMYDVTTFGDAVHKFLAGKRSISFEHAGYLNAGAARSHPALKTNNIDGVVSMFLGQNAEPVAGDPTYSLMVRQGKYSVIPAIGNFVPFSAMFANRGNRGGWGVALAVPTVFANTIAGAEIDNGVATANGGAAFLHVLLAAAMDRYTFYVQGSTTGAFIGEETNLGTFTLDASVLASERIEIAGSIPRYTRVYAVRTGSAGNSVKAAISLIRY